MTLSEQSVLELKWWSANVLDAFKPNSHEEPSLVITTDASLSGWGAEFQSITTGGMWSHIEAPEYKNV